MVRDIGHDPARSLGLIDSIELIPSYNKPDLSEFVVNEGKKLAQKMSENPNFWDGDKFCTEQIFISKGQAKVYIAKGPTYSQVLASRNDSNFSPELDPILWMYKVLGNEEDGLSFIRNNINQVNPLTQGVMLFTLPSNYLNSENITAEHLQALITIRGDAVDHGVGLHHIFAGYADLAKGFNHFRFGTPNAIRSIEQELYEEGALEPDYLITGVDPFTITQDGFEPQIEFLAITKKNNEEVAETLRKARDWNEMSNYLFVPVGELRNFAQDNPFYSHSRPMVNELYGPLVSKLNKMLGRSERAIDFEKAFVLRHED